MCTYLVAFVRDLQTYFYIVKFCGCNIYFNTYICIVSIAVAVYFNQSVYNVNEADGSVQPVIVLHNAPLINVTIEVFSTIITACGEYHIYSFIHGTK